MQRLLRCVWWRRLRVHGAGATRSRQSCRYSHLHLADLGYGGNFTDVEEVRFFCNTSAHSRVMHFKTSDSHVREVAFTGDHRGLNSASRWNTGWTALDGHSAYLPAATTNAVFVQSNGFIDHPFYYPYKYHWLIRGHNRWECDDYPRGYQHTTRHQVWVRQSAPTASPTSVGPTASPTTRAPTTTVTDI